MKRVLIVDDEKYFRKALIVSVNWAAVGYEVCGEAENGKEALEKMQQLLPDVVITDINMSKMDGLTLIEQLRAQKADVKIIVISGYDEFDYVRRSLVLGVYNYIVKPVDPQELERILAEVAALIEKERGLRSRMEALRTTLDSALSVLKAQYLCKILAGNVPANAAELDSMVKKNGICLTAPPFVVVAFEILPSHTAQWNSADCKLWTYAVENISGELLREKYLCETTIEDVNRVMAVLCFDGSEERLQQQLSILCCLVQDNLDFSLAVGVGKPRNALQDVHLSCKEALFAIQESRLPGRGGVCFYSNISTVDFLSHRGALYDKGELLMQMRLGDDAACSALLHRLQESLLQMRASIQSIHVTLVELLSALFEYASENAACLSGNLTDWYAAFFAQIATCNEPDKLFAQLEAMLHQLLEQVRSQRNKQVSDIVRRALEIIHTRYAEDTLTVDVIAQDTFASYGYLCYLFKKDTGRTLNDYLTDYRMEQAQQLLAREDAFVGEVAQRVGFANANYFSKIFKKRFGMLPSEMRPK